MSGSNPGLAFGFLYWLGAVCLLQPVPAWAVAPGIGAISPARSVILIQAEKSPLLPSLVLPPDALAGPPMFVNLMRLGDSAMLHGNVVQARLFYERALAIYPASTAALLAAGKTYDPGILASMGSSNFANSVLARNLYEHARTLGDPAAAELLARLP